MKIVIIGASGFIGSKLRRIFSDDYDVIGTYFSQKRPGLVYLNLVDHSSIQNFLKMYKPELLIHCGGLTKSDVCETNKDLAKDINIKGTECLVKSIKSKIIYISTDYVFDGLRGNYTEDDEPNPVNFYGETKFQAERIVLRSDNNVVLRLSGLYGFNKDNNAFIDLFCAHKEIKQPEDSVSSPTLIDDVAKNLQFFFDKEGIYHLAGSVPMSRYDFSCLAVKTLSLPTLIVPDKIENIYFLAKRPKNSSLSTIRHRIKMSSPMDGLKKLKQQLELEMTFLNRLHYD